MIFSMVSDLDNPQLYYQVYIGTDGHLKCAPFGSQAFTDPIVSFDEFSLENEDTYGWWHISCSYSFQENVKGILYNSNVYQSREETMKGLPKFYPINSLISSFG